MKNKLGVALLALAIAGAWSVEAREEEAPISAGTFLVYDNAGMQMRLTFSPADGDRFDANIEYAYDDGMFEPAPPSSAQGDMVDTHMRTADGGIFELGPLGPLWVPVKSRVVCKSERKLLDASVRLPWQPPWARGVRGPGNGARSRPQ